MKVELSPRPQPVQGDPGSLAPEVAERRSAWPVALVNMPFTSALRPSLQIATLAPIGRSHGFPVDTFHLNLDFSAAVGPNLYELLCTYLGWPTGEWLFSEALFGPDAPDLEQRFLDDYEERLSGVLSQVDADLDTLRHLRDVQVPAFLDHCEESVDWSAYRVVGFTSTFQQNAASFALATRLKARHPDLVVLFGGANFEGPMGREWVQSVPAIDLAVDGEADLAFSQLLVALSEGRDPLEVPGVITRRDGQVVASESLPPFDRMDELPLPDYDEYFARGEARGLIAANHGAQILPFESARGCWWGAKRHCTFCGLNGGAMAYRAKSAERVEAELAALTRRYRSFRLDAADNILEPSYVDTLFPRLAEAGTSYQLFYEVKADLTRAQMATVRAGGMRRMQPGIESLSTHVLALMRKGVRGIQNVNILRWGLYYGIDVCWNIIYGFPGETDDDQRYQADLMPHLVHLQPPTSCGRITLDRFSPLFQDRETFASVDVRPDDRLRYVYPEAIDTMQVATSFDHRFPEALPDSAYLDLEKQAAAWKAAWDDAGDDRPRLAWWRAPGVLQIEDLRRPEEPGTHTFEDPLAALYLACADKPVKAEQVRDALDLPYDLDEVTGALDEFCQRGLMMRDGKLYLALALPATGGYPLHGSDSAR